MIDRLAVRAKAAGAIGHQTLALVPRISWHRLVLRDRQNFALAALRRVERDHVIAGATLVTPGPTSTTMPAPSWPRIAGRCPRGRRRTVCSRCGRCQWPLISTSTSRPVSALRDRRFRWSGCARFPGDGGFGFHANILCGNVACSVFVLLVAKPCQCTTNLNAAGATARYEPRIGQQFAHGRRAPTEALAENKMKWLKARAWGRTGCDRDGGGCWRSDACCQWRARRKLRRQKLVVVVLVDGLPQEQLLKNYDLFVPNGLRRLMDKGAWFSDAHQAHAFTVTAVGHATILRRLSLPDGHHRQRLEKRATAKFIYNTADTAHKYLDGTPRRMKTAPVRSCCR